MLFSSATFLYFFLPVVTAAYYIFRNRAWRNAVLLVFSLLFYSWGEPKYILLMIASTLIAYLCGLAIDRYRDRKKLKKAFMLIAIIMLLGSLVVFKYLNLITDTISSLSGAELSVREIALPIGISFYTFQILSYIIDLYRGSVRVQKNYFYFALYVSFFPQLIAGPIVRYSTVEEEIRNREESWDDAIYGLRRFIIGLAKKVLIANSAAAVSDYIYSLSSGVGTGALWLAAVCYTLQIYFDFSGYSDMAIGLGRIFGFHFLENFNYPYIAKSVTDFWRRWHISLSSWFRDYVYIPLGGNRVKKSRWILNILIVWGLTGLWHGASWNFVAWGLYYAVLLIIEKLFLSKILNRLPGILQWIYTMFIVVVGWVLFNITDFAQLASVLSTMFSASETNWTALYAGNAQISKYLLFLPLAVLFSFPVAKKIKISNNSAVEAVFVNGFYLVLIAVCIMFIISSSYNPFIYFRF